MSDGYKEQAASREHWDTKRADEIDRLTRELDEARGLLRDSRREFSKWLAADIITLKLRTETLAVTDRIDAALEGTTVQPSAESRDAARYRWLRDRVGWRAVYEATDEIAHTPREVDSAVDKARAADNAPAPAPQPSAESPSPANPADDPASYYNPIHQVFFRAGLIACREYMARFVEVDSPAIAASIRANWWPRLGQDLGPPRLLKWEELTEGEYGTDSFRPLTKGEISPTLEALPVALGFLRPTDNGTPAP